MYLPVRRQHVVDLRGRQHFPLPTRHASACLLYEQLPRRIIPGFQMPLKIGVDPPTGHIAEVKRSGTGTADILAGQEYRLEPLKIPGSFFFLIGSSADCHQAGGDLPRLRALDRNAIAISSPPPLRCKQLLGKRVINSAEHHRLPIIKCQ